MSPDAIADMVKQVLSNMAQGQSAPAAASTEAAPSAPASGHLDAARDYPLASKRPDLVQSASGLQLNDITLEKVIAGEIEFKDIKIRPETLEYQAQIAESAGRPHLAANMRRAAEMTRIPDERVLEIYNSLRPYRCSKQELLEIATELESQYQAKICAALVREAADVYEKRGRLKQP
ncbi:diol dehydratase small subunit [Desulfobulbus rhabdoformis]|jgi:propanediol dehydratase small subunit|uniref:diol dehydratase small subunit n=1 Tax=Desulfobulbus rhabdoformis TaxID=34032 RepID=UPI003B8303CB